MIDQDKPKQSTLDDGKPKQLQFGAWAEPPKATKAKAKAPEEKIVRGAEFSADGLYRFMLTRAMPERPVNRTMVCVLLNPSVAGAVDDDPTADKCWHYAKRENCDELIIVNFGAYVATDPDHFVKLAKAGTNVIGFTNDAWIQKAIEDAHVVVVGWGNHAAGKPFKEELIRLNFQLQRFARTKKAPVLCFGRNKNGTPTHPLYQKNDAPLVPYFDNIATVRTLGEDEGVFFVEPTTGLASDPMLVGAPDAKRAIERGEEALGLPCRLLDPAKAWEIAKTLKGCQ